MEEKSIITYLSQVETRRPHNGYHYNVGQAITIVVLGLMCGLKNLSQISHWAEHEHIREFLRVSFGIEKIPCYFWLTCLIRIVDPVSLDRCFMEWVESMIPEDKAGLTIAFDGKTIRSTVKEDCNKNPLHIVSAYISELGMTFAQKAVDAKKNEIPTVQGLLQELKIGGCLVVADALNCQKKTAEIVVGKGADYLFDVKSNHKSLKADIEGYVKDDTLRGSMDTARTMEKSRDRIEERTAYCTQDIDWMEGKERWAGLTSIGAICKREERKGKQSKEWHYYISSKALTAEELLRHARQEWSVETMHWLLDVHFEEDSCRVLDDDTQKTLNILRKTALNLIKRFKHSTHSRLPYSKIMLSCLVDCRSILPLLEN